MLRKILALLVIVCASAGLLLCLAGLIGVWVANTPLTNVITTTAAAGHETLTLAVTTTTAIHDQIQRFQTEITHLEGSVAGMTAETRAEITGRIKDTAQRQFGPTLDTLRTTVIMLRTGVVALNSALESANRIPSVNLPTFTDQLEAAGQRLDEIHTHLATLQAAATDLSLDGSRIEAALTALNEQLVAVQDLLARLLTQITAVDQALVAFGAAAPGRIDLASAVLSLLAILFGAGQLCLILRGVSFFCAAT